MYKRQGDVTPANAQKGLNYAVDYTTLNFTPGNYGKLEIRNRNIDKIKNGYYERTLQHLTLTSQQGAVIENFLVGPGPHINSQGSPMVNYATGEDYLVNEANGYYSICLLYTSRCV